MKWFNIFFSLLCFETPILLGDPMSSSKFDSGLEYSRLSRYRDVKDDLDYVAFQYKVIGNHLINYFDADGTISNKTKNRIDELFGINQRFLNYIIAIANGEEAKNPFFKTEEDEKLLEEQPKIENNQNTTADPEKDGEGTEDDENGQGEDDEDDEKQENDEEVVNETKAEEENQGETDQNDESEVDILDEDINQNQNDDENDDGEDKENLEEDLTEISSALKKVKKLFGNDYDLDDDFSPARKRRKKISSDHDETLSIRDDQDELVDQINEKDDEENNDENLNEDSKENDENVETDDNEKINEEETENGEASENFEENNEIDEGNEKLDNIQNRDELELNEDSKTDEEETKTDLNHDSLKDSDNGDATPTDSDKINEDDAADENSENGEEPSSDNHSIKKNSNKKNSKIPRNANYDIQSELIQESSDDGESAVDLSYSQSIADGSVNYSDNVRSSSTNTFVQGISSGVDSSSRITNISSDDGKLHIEHF